MGTKIQSKVVKVKNANFKLGRPLSLEVKIDYGGTVQKFENATFYYHSVMKDACFLHGDIRTRYLQLGGPGPEPRLHKRLLGFPLSDVKYTEDGRCEFVEFEWGRIYDIYDTVYLCGPVYDHWKRSGAESGPLGYPVSNQIHLAGGEVVYFEFGALYCGVLSENKIVQVNYRFPSLGKPMILKETELDDHKCLTMISYNAGLDKNEATQLFNTLFSGFFLQAVQNRKAVNLLPATEKMISTTTSINHVDFKGYSIPLRFALNQKVEEKTLYDICIALPNGGMQILSPHSIYIRNGWKDFKFIHATDLHLSRRNDKLRAILKAKKIDATPLVNFNDSFRRLIKYANTLYRKGELDFIMATGDLVDYVFDHPTEKTYNYNNFVLFEQLVTGTAGIGDELTGERLLVPIFTSLGNHDYRTVPYNFVNSVLVDDSIKDQFKKWADDIKNGIPGPVDNLIIGAAGAVVGTVWDGLVSGVKLIGSIFGADEDTWAIDLDQFDSFNLEKREAEALMGSKEQTITAAEARAMVTPDERNAKGNLDYYVKYINPRFSYNVQLGKHQLVMIDGKWDIDVKAYMAGALLAKASAGSETAQDFVSGSPDSFGFTKKENDMMKDLLHNDGLVIVGVHAPVLNPIAEDYPYFLRESLRNLSKRAFTNEMRRYLYNRSASQFLIKGPNGIPYADLRKNVLKSWMRDKTPYFNFGDGQELMDYATMRGEKAEFLKICAGAYGQRPVDLVLSGHVHVNWEVRVEWDKSSGKFKFYTDFYTENPNRFYNFKVNSISTDKLVVASSNKTAIAKVYIDKKGSADPKVIKATNGALSLTTIPNPGALEHVKPQDAKKWWENKRPLFIQTSAVGPIKTQRGGNSAPDFRGCRYIQVKDDVITRISYVMQDEINKSAPNIIVHDHRTPSTTAVGTRTQPTATTGPTTIVKVVDHRTPTTGTGTRGARPVPVRKPVTVKRSGIKKAGVKKGAVVRKVSSPLRFR